MCTEWCFREVFWLGCRQHVTMCVIPVPSVFLTPVRQRTGTSKALRGRPKCCWENGVIRPALSAGCVSLGHALSRSHSALWLLLLKSPLPPHVSSLFSYLLFFTLFCSGARIWWCSSNRNHSQWRSGKTRLSPFLWICHLQPLCVRGKGSVPKNMDFTVMLSWAFQYKWKPKFFLKMYYFGFFLNHGIHWFLCGLFYVHYNILYYEIAVS